MEPDEALRKIQQMSISEKIVALNPTDKAYIQGFIERAIWDNYRNRKRGKGNRKKAKQNG